MEEKRIINEFISHPRFEKYVISCGGDLDLAFELFGLLKAEPKKAFSNIPRGTKRDVIHKTLKTVLDFRNRIYHNEPICFGTDIRLNKPMIDLTKVQDVYDSLYTALFWIGGKALLEWTQNRIDGKSMIYETAKVNEIIKKVGVGKPFAIPITP